MITSIINRISGRDRHWKQDYVPYMEFIHQRSLLLPVTVSSFFVNVSAVSATVTGLITEYEAYPQLAHFKFIEKDIRTMSQRDFQNLHNYIMWVLIAISLSIHPKCKKNRDIQADILYNGEQLIGRNSNEKSTVMRIMGLQDPDFGIIAAIAYPGLTIALNYDDKGSMLDNCFKLSEVLSRVSNPLLRGFDD